MSSDLNIDAGRFSVRLAENDTDLKAAQKLRYDVFVKEMGASVPPEQEALGIEQDKYDEFCDHLILIDNQHPDHDTPQVVGVYRLMRKSAAKIGFGFYSSGEFDLTKLINHPKETLELGRTCIAKTHRGGVSLQLMWMGLAQYVVKNNIEIMFGCASFHGADISKHAEALTFLHRNHLVPEELRTRVLAEHYTSLNQLPDAEISKLDAMKQVPALIKSYLKLGGFVGDGAFIDNEFKTVDVCLIMETDKIAEKQKQFYSRKPPETLARILG